MNTQTYEELVSESAQATEAKEQWRPTTEEDVEFVLGLIAKHEAAARAIQTKAERMAGAELRQAEAIRERYRQDLEKFAAERIKNQKTKTVELLNGKLYFISQPTKVELTGTDDELAELAREVMPDAVTVVTNTKVNKTTLKSVLTPVETETGPRVMATTTGQVVTAARVVPEEERFYIGV